MSLPLGLVGLPNAGKSTLFNALTRTQAAQAENYPFCTIEPNVGMVAIHDPILQELSVLGKSKRVIPESLEFVDIAGLVKNAHAGEGLGNQFLSHIRECSAIGLVLRFFEDGNIIHVDGKINPATDREVIETELLLADLATVQKVADKSSRAKKSGKTEDIDRAAVHAQLLAALESGAPARSVELDEALEPYRYELHLLTNKPVIYIANVAEDAITTTTEDQVRERLGLKSEDIVVIVSAQIEAELSQLSEEEAAAFLEDMGIEVSGLVQVATKAHQILGLQTFYTVGEQEARAWTCPQGALPPQAAGVIHTDFIKHFVRAEAVSAENFLKHGGWSGAREVGVVRLEGKEGHIDHGDVVYFRTTA